MPEPITQISSRPAAGRATSPPRPPDASGLAPLIALVEALEESEILPFLRGLAESSDRLAVEIADWVTEPENERVLRNAAALYRILREMNPKDLQRIGEGIQRGVLRAREAMDRGETLGLLSLRRTLRNPDVNRGLRAFLGFLQGLGEPPAP